MEVCRLPCQGANQLTSLIVFRVLALRGRAHPILSTDETN
jgi:hypothetical protein